MERRNSITAFCRGKRRQQCDNRCETFLRTHRDATTFTYAIMRFALASSLKINFHRRWSSKEFIDDDLPQVDLSGILRDMIEWFGGWFQCKVRLRLCGRFCSLNNDERCRDHRSSWREFNKIEETLNWFLQFSRKKREFTFRNVRRRRCQN